MKPEINYQQKSAITVDEKNVLILAGAGSGKSFTLIERVAYLLEKGIVPSRILVLTFTRRAANELVNRLINRYKHANEINTGTFHRFCLWAIKSYPAFFSSLNNLIIIDRDDQLAIIRRCRKEWISAQKFADQTESSYLKAVVLRSEKIISLLSYSRNKNMELKKYLTKYFNFLNVDNDKKIDVLYRSTFEILTEYRRQKKISQYLDFDDILIEFTLAIEKDKEFKNILKNKFEHILVDEIQDTNVIQWRILESLIMPAKLFCVGDDAQNIYGFRGATPDNTNYFLNRVPDSTRLKLTINYRSSQRILDLANFVLRQSTHNYDKELVGTRQQGKMPILKDFLSADKAARWITSDVISKVLENESLKLSDIMILTRSAWLARPLEGILTENKINYRFIGGVSLFNAAHVKDILAVCRAAFNYKDIVSWLRVLNFFPKIGNKTASNLFNKIKKCQTNKQLLEIINTKSTLQPTLNDCLNMCWKNKDNPHQLLTNVINLVDELIAKRYILDWDKRINDWYLLARLAKKFYSIFDFIETYTLDPITTSDASNQNKDALSIITIHSAKGLEAKNCYIIEGQNGSFPHSKAVSDEEIEEERRVLYVAITRAKDELIITRSINEINFAAVNDKEDFIDGISKSNFVVHEKVNPFYFVRNNSFIKTNPYM